MRHLTIGLDADGTLFDLVTPWLELWAEKAGRPAPAYEQIVQYNAHLCVGPDGAPLSPEDERLFYSLLEYPGLFDERVKVCEVGRRYAEKWHAEGHEVRIVSAPAGPESARGKLRAFARTFPWLNRKHIDLMHHKHRLDLDVLVDDSPDVVRKCVSCMTLGIAQPWNEKVADADLIWSCLARSWREPEKAWAEIDRHIQDLANGFGVRT